MQTTITSLASYIATGTDAIRPATQPDAHGTRRAFVKLLARQWDMIGVAAVMGASAVYALGQLMTLTH